MRVLVQKVTEASVTVNGRKVSEISKGYVIFIGVEKGDTRDHADYLAKKVSHLRIFEDENQKMNLSVHDVDGAVLVVSQFTLAGDTSRGNRPGFETAARPEEAEPLYEYFVQKLKEEDCQVKTGIFQTDMKVALINDGPTTFILERRG